MFSNIFFYPFPNLIAEMESGYEGDTSPPPPETDGKIDRLKAHMIPTND
jgi:hypothetical protein